MNNLTDLINELGYLHQIIELIFIIIYLIFIALYKHNGFHPVNKRFLKYYNPNNKLIMKLYEIILKEISPKDDLIANFTHITLKEYKSKIHGINDLDDSVLEDFSLFLMKKIQLGFEIRLGKIGRYHFYQIIRNWIYKAADDELNRRLKTIIQKKIETDRCKCNRHCEKTSNIAEVETYV